MLPSYILLHNADTVGLLHIVGSLHNYIKNTAVIIQSTTNTRKRLIITALVVCCVISVIDLLTLMPCMAETAPIIRPKTTLFNREAIISAKPIVSSTLEIYTPRVMRLPKPARR